MSHPLLDLWFRAGDAADDLATPPPRTPAPPRAATRAPDADDPSLIARIRAGDDLAFDALYTATFRELWSLARRYVGTAEAEEVVQDVFLRVWERRAEWTISTTARAYLFGAVRNRALHRVEHASVEQRASAAAAAEREGDAAAPVDGANDVLDAVARAVAALPERQRAAMVLRVQRELSHAELGEALGVSAAAAGMLVRKAEAKLRVALAAYLTDV